jgi:hypothetical protein
MVVIIVSTSSSCKKITNGDFTFTFEINQTIPNLLSCLQTNSSVVCNEIFFSEPSLTHSEKIFLICFFTILPGLFIIWLIYYNRKDIKKICDTEMV